jgi:hypothetical protein
MQLKWSVAIWSLPALIGPVCVGTTASMTV